MLQAIAAVADVHAADGSIQMVEGWSCSRRFDLVDDDVEIDKVKNSKLLVFTDGGMLEFKTCCCGFNPILQNILVGQIFMSLKVILFSVFYNKCNYQNIKLEVGAVMEKLRKAWVLD